MSSLSRLPRASLSETPTLLAAFVLFAATSYAGSTIAADGKDLSVTGNNVNVRIAPKRSSERIAQLSKGHLVRELNRTGNRVEIEILGSQGATGWIYRDYVDIITELHEPITCSGRIEGDSKGTHGQIYWESLAFNSSDRYCLRRRIEISDEPWRYLISWPLRTS
jgi:hypothetical protein